MNKKLLILLLSLVVFIGSCTFIFLNKKNQEKEEKQMIYNVEMKVKDYGIITLELDRNEAPITVDNFVSLVENGFYDGLKFHRIMDGFMIQGGDGRSLNRTSNTIKGEFKNNGIENNIHHVRGVISMARTFIRDSASTQFFIVQSDSLFLDGNYAGFGHVTSGMEVVDEICKKAKPTDDNGTIKESEQPIIEYIKIVK